MIRRVQRRRGRGSIMLPKRFYSSNTMVGQGKSFRRLAGGVGRNHKLIRVHRSLAGVSPLNSQQAALNLYTDTVRSGRIGIIRQCVWPSPETRSPKRRLAGSAPGWLDADCSFCWLLVLTAITMLVTADMMTVLHNNRLCSTAETTSLCIPAALQRHGQRLQ